MANTKSAIKNIRKNIKQREHNRVFRSQARTFIKKARQQIETGKLEEARVTTQLAIKALDKAAQKNIIHPNNASRRKSRLIKQLNKALEAQAGE